MKFEIVECPQCGTEFKRTNPRKEYCSGACRVGAHRDRHGYQMPIFDKEQVRLVERILKISPLGLEMLAEDAVKYRIIREIYETAAFFNIEKEMAVFQEVFDRIKLQQDNDGQLYIRALDTVQFINPIKWLLEYMQENPVSLYKRGSL